MVEVLNNIEEYLNEISRLEKRHPDYMSGAREAIRLIRGYIDAASR